MRNWHATSVHTAARFLRDALLHPEDSEPSGQEYSIGVAALSTWASADCSRIGHVSRANPVGVPTCATRLRRKYRQVTTRARLRGRGRSAPAAYPGRRGRCASRGVRKNPQAVACGKELRELTKEAPVFITGASLHSIASKNIPATIIHTSTYCHAFSFSLRNSRDRMTDSAQNDAMNGEAMAASPAA